MFFSSFHYCAVVFFYYVRSVGDVLNRLNRNLTFQEANMTRDQLNRELRMHSASWPAVLIVYGIIVATMVFSAMSIT